MLTKREVVDAMLSARRQYWATVKDRREGWSSRDLLPRVEMQRDILACLLDEAPVERHRAVHLLLDQYDALMRELVS